MYVQEYVRFFHPQKIGQIHMYILRKIYKIYTILFLLLLPLGAAGQAFNDTIDRGAEDFVTVSVLICEPYEVLYSSLGHVALRLQCPIYELDYVFSYEGENVRNQIGTFLKGDLKMGMYAFPTDLFLRLYESVGRGVAEYKMNLSPAHEQQLWRTMDEMQTAGMTLPYDFFKRGCAKSVVMVVKKVVGPSGIHYAPWPDKYTKHTIRELVREAITDLPWTEFILYFLIGSEVEQPMSCEQKLIVPNDLVEVWQQATFDNGSPVLDSEGKELVRGTWVAQPVAFTPLMAAILLLLLAIGSWLTQLTDRRAWRIAGEVADYTVLTVVTALGALMTYLVVFSSLPCTSWNWLIIPFNILPPIGWYWRKYWALPYAGMVLVWCLVMAGEWCWGHILVDWPHILLALALGVVLLKHSPILSYLHSKK